MFGYAEPYRKDSEGPLTLYIIQFGVGECKADGGVFLEMAV